MIADRLFPLIEESETLHEAWLNDAVFAHTIRTALNRANRGADDDDLLRVLLEGFALSGADRRRLLDRLIQNEMMRPSTPLTVRPDG